MKKAIYLMMCFMLAFGFGFSANALSLCLHVWVFDYDEYMNLTDDTHEVISHYYCKKCYDEDERTKNIENCDFSERSKYPDYTSNNDGKTHTVKTEVYCSKCKNSQYENITENCQGEKTSYIYISATKHKKYGDCEKCSQELCDVYSHKYGWVDKEGMYEYECTSGCLFTPKFDGITLWDFDSVDNISVKKGKTRKDKLSHYKAKYNTIKSAKSNKKKVCTVSYKKGTVTFKGKKKGKAKITIKMKSGAKYIYNVKVK